MACLTWRRGLDSRCGGRSRDSRRPGELCSPGPLAKGTAFRIQSWFGIGRGLFAPSQSQTRTGSKGVTPLAGLQGAEPHGLMHPVPILLVAGFLGAGKTTVVNHLLAHAEGRRIAAVVNDFGAINIDAELIAGASDGVVSLSNGCICCSLEGDLLRTLAALLRRDPRPEFIVIETSGVADPADIVRNLMDPMIWREAPLETVLCVVAATTPEAMLADPLLRSQLRTADAVALTKLDLAGSAEVVAVRDAVRAVRPGAVVVDALLGEVPAALLFPADPDRVPRPRDLGRRRPTADRFETLSWTSERLVSLPRLQQAISR